MLALMLVLLTTWVAGSCPSNSKVKKVEKLMMMMLKTVEDFGDVYI